MNANPSVEQHVFPEQSYNLPAGIKLNIGCGPVQPPGWVNLDGSNRAWLASKLTKLDSTLTRLRVIPPTSFGSHIKYHNLFKGLPYQAGTVAAIYAGEVWEHFEYNDAMKLTRECYAALAPGGVLRVCVPDGPTFWRDYLKLFDDMMSRPRPLRSTGPLKERVQMYFREICTRKKLLGSMGHTHKWQFDEIQLIEMFELSGFTQVDRMPFHSSRIPDVDLVERSDFLIVEGIKA